MFSPLILNLIMILVGVQCNPTHDKTNGSPIKVSDGKVPNFCDEHYIDSAFSNHKSEIRMTRKDWIWNFNEKEKKLQSPQKQDPKETFLLQSKVYISRTPECKSNDKICTDIGKAKHLIIILFRERKSDFLGSYQVRKVVNGSITNIDDKDVLPFGLERSGNIFSSGQLFWPKEFSLYENQYDKKHTAMVYSPKNYEIIIIVNGITKEGTKACFNQLNPKKNWSNTWKCNTLEYKWIYVGMFLLNNNIYVIGVKDTNSRVFIYADHQLRDTELNIQQYLGCEEKVKVKSRSLRKQESDKSESDKSSSSFVIIIVGLVVGIIVFLVFVLMIIFAVRKSKSKPKATEEMSSKLRPINKDNDVDETKIGALSSKLDWNIKVSQISTASGEPLDITAKPKVKKPSSDNNNK